MALPKYLTLGELVQVARTLADTEERDEGVLQRELNWDFDDTSPLLKGRFSRAEFFEVIIELVGEDKIRQAAQGELDLNEAAAMLGEQITTNMRQGNWSEAVKLQHALGELIAKKEKVVELTIEAAIMQLFPGVSWDYKTDPLEWGQEKKATREWLKENYGFDDEAPDTLVLIPSPEQMYVGAYAKIESGKKKVLRLLETLDIIENESNTAFCRRVGQLVGVHRTHNGITATNPFDLKGWKVEA